MLTSVVSACSPLKSDSWGYVFKPLWETQVKWDREICHEFFLFVFVQKKRREKRESRCRANTLPLFLINFLSQFYSKKPFSGILCHCHKWHGVRRWFFLNHQKWGKKIKIRKKVKTIAKVQLLPCLWIWEELPANQGRVALPLLYSQAQRDTGSSRGKVRLLT